MVNKFNIGDRVVVKMRNESIPIGLHGELHYAIPMRQYEGDECVITEAYTPDDGVMRYKLSINDWNYHESWLELVEEIKPDYAYKYFDLEEEYNMLEDDFYEISNKCSDLANELYELRNEYSDMKTKLNEVTNERDELEDGLIEVENAYSNSRKEIRDLNSQVEKWIAIYDEVLNLYMNGDK